MSRTEKLLMEMIALPSVNPAFLPAGDSRAGERRVSEFVATVAASAGLDVEFREAMPERPNLLARLSCGGKVQQRILLAPHLDTVGAAPRQFTPRRSNGRIYGRGACDTKGSAASMLAALCDLARRPGRPRHTEFIFAGLVDEENAQGGSRALARSGMKAHLAIVGEPTGLKVVTAHKGNLWLRLETQGKTAHASRPELGSNAVHAMARVVVALQERYAAGLRRRRHPLLGTATASVGKIAGGTQANIVPGACTLLLDRRTLPGETEAGVKREIKALLARLGSNASITMERPEPCPPLETNPDLPLVAWFLRSVGQRQPAGVHYFCDAAVLNRAGIPSVVFGPGDIAQAHTADEWISMCELNQATRMLLRFFRSLP